MEHHPLDSFKYCPKCGNNQFLVETFKSKKCSLCGFHYFYNPAAAVGVFVLNERGELLVGKRTFEPAKNTLDLPGGFVDFGENAETAAIREIEEETGLQLEVKQLEYLFSLPNEYIFSGFKVSTMDIFFKCIVSNGLVKGKDDISELKWVDIKSLDPSLFGLQSISQAVEMFMKSFQ
ncbi:hypothetical protein ENUP19_0002G0051 [Entamoeba nuttalli]|uniref:MutT/nudix family protein n=2 Tax=Entamoeba nuttalli TaxID=412467 RepID=K2G513_ENTNP|nr:mutT/nudix family protein [Entamoeba nuttalli P19]EKE37426.1 mutT/nudix family protein [Entamoeba nuttalli P19]|eukprot:XP_008860235.1 mutT/nudix family protein [Entamoeba nuttalli P19]